MPYINKSWKRVFYNGEEFRTSYYREYYNIKKLSSFMLGRFEGLSYANRWTLCCNRKAHIYSWLVSYLNIEQASSAVITLNREELEEFLNQLDYMLEVIYARN
jgi:hypothetical protein